MLKVASAAVSTPLSVIAAAIAVFPLLTDWKRKSLSSGVNPASPLGPWGPWGPVSPLSPLSPFGPTGPAGPCGPCGPSIPSSIILFT